MGAYVYLPLPWELQDAKGGHFRKIRMYENGKVNYFGQAQIFVCCNLGVLISIQRRVHGLYGRRNRTRYTGYTLRAEILKFLPGKICLFDLHC